MELGTIAIFISSELNKMANKVEEIFARGDLEGAKMYLSYLKQGNDILEDIKKRNEQNNNIWFRGKKRNDNPR